MLHMIGFLVTAVSAVVLATALRGIWNLQRSLSVRGINEPVPLSAKSRFIVGGWAVALIVGIALIVFG